MANVWRRVCVQKEDLFCDDFGVRKTVAFPSLGAVGFLTTPTQVFCCNYLLELHGFQDELRIFFAACHHGVPAG
jgi:hypothetical protein